MNKENNFKVKCLDTDGWDFLTKNKVYEFVNGHTFWDEGDSSTYKNYEDFKNHSGFNEGIFELVETCEQKEFDWQEFKAKNIAVHCKTEEEGKDFIKQAYKKGIMWSDKDINRINFDCYKHDTCYSCGAYIKNQLEFCCKAYFEDNKYKMVEWKDYMDDNEDKEKYNLTVQDIIDKADKKATYSLKGSNEDWVYRDGDIVNEYDESLADSYTVGGLLELRFKKLKPQIIKTYIEPMKAVKLISEGKPVWWESETGNNVLFNNPKANKVKIDMLLNGKWFVKEEV